VSGLPGRCARGCGPPRGSASARRSRYGSGARSWSPVDPR